MKTLLEITGKDSGYIIYRHPTGHDEAIVANWASLEEEYNIDRRHRRRVNNCWDYLAERLGTHNAEWLDDEGNLVVETTINHIIIYAEPPPTQGDLEVSGTLYSGKDFDILVPDSWN